MGCVVKRPDRVDGVREHRELDDVVGAVLVVEEAAGGGSEGFLDQRGRHDHRRRFDGGIEVGVDADERPEAPKRLGSELVDAKTGVDQPRQLCDAALPMGRPHDRNHTPTGWPHASAGAGIMPSWTRNQCTSRFPHRSTILPSRNRKILIPGMATVRFGGAAPMNSPDRKSTRLNSSHLGISYAVFCLK